MANSVSGDRWARSRALGFFESYATFFALHTKADDMVGPRGLDARTESRIDIATLALVVVASDLIGHLLGINMPASPNKAKDFLRIPPDVIAMRARAIGEFTAAHPQDLHEVLTAAIRVLTSHGLLRAPLGSPGRPKDHRKRRDNEVVEDAFLQRVQVLLNSGKASTITCAIDIVPRRDRPAGRKKTLQNKVAAAKRRQGTGRPRRRNGSTAA